MISQWGLLHGMYSVCVALQVVSRTKLPQEIMEEYERLQQEREERRLQQSTNPKVHLMHA